MSTALLQELHQEVRRLYIAGSDLAPGDFRLKRLLPQFQQLGERAAIFKRLGEGIAELLEAGAGQGLSTAVKLQDLTLLLGSVLYTQGTSAPDGDIADIESQQVYLSTSFPYRKLAEVHRALSTTGSGRHEIVVEAFKSGMFHDLRLFPFAIKALDDPYVEIAEYARDTILPAYGPPVAEHLIKVFNPAGGKNETRKLRVIHKVGGEEVLELIHNAAENGSDEVRITAIELLAGHARYEDALLGWSREKKKAIREVAYQALAAGGTAKGAERLYEAFSGKDMELVAQALSYTPIVELDERIVEAFALELKQAAVPGQDKKQAEALWNRIRHYLRALRGKQLQTLTDVYSEVLRNYSLYISNSWLELIDDAVEYIERLQSPEALKQLQEVEKLNSRYVPNAFRLAYHVLTPKQLYDHYAGTLLTKLVAFMTKDSKQKELKLFQIVEEMVMKREYMVSEAVWSSSSGRNFSFTSILMMPSGEIATRWDPRWLKWFKDKEKLELVSVFARPDEPAVEQFLLLRLENNPEFRNRFATIALMGLERAGAAPAVRSGALMTALEDKRNNNCYIFDIYIFEQICQLPASYQQRLEAILPFYKHEAGEQLQYALRLIQQRGDV